MSRNMWILAGLMAILSLALIYHDEIGMLLIMSSVRRVWSPRFLPAIVLSGPQLQGNAAEMNGNAR